MKKYYLLIFLIISIIGLSACSNNSNTSTNNTDTGTTNSTQTTDKSPTGDWKYTGSIDNKNYEIDLDLENDSQFELTIDEESAEDKEDSEVQGTYVVEDNKIRLSIMTVQDLNSYFSGTVVENGQVELDYTLSDDGNTLTINNAPDSISILPGNLELKRS